MARNFFCYRWMAIKAILHHLRSPFPTGYLIICTLSGSLGQCRGSRSWCLLGKRRASFWEVYVLSGVIKPLVPRMFEEFVRENFGALDVCRNNSVPRLFPFHLVLIESWVGVQLWAGIAVPIGERYRRRFSGQFLLPSDMGVYSVVYVRGLREREKC